MKTDGGVLVRNLAVDVLFRVLYRGAYADIVLGAELSRASLDVADSALVTEIVYGVLRRLKTIDWTLDGLLKRPIKQAARDVALVLRVGAYQIMYLDRIPAYAAVDTAVDLVARRKHPKARSLVNAVLRRLLREGPRAVPIDLDEAERIAIEHSHPTWFVRSMIDRHGALTTQEICAANNRIPSLYLRVNRLRTQKAELIALLSEQGIVTQDCRYAPSGLEVLKGSGLIPRSTLSEKGFFYVMDEASMLVSPALGPSECSTVLDACAAPGGKTAHLADIMGDTGRIIALDPKDARLRTIEQNARRLGVTSVVTQALDAREAGLHYPEEFDAALVDAPCSGTGVYARRPDARWKPRDLCTLQRLQSDILDGVAESLKPGGTLVYSTCSVLEEENGCVVTDFLARHPEFELQTLTDKIPPSLVEDETGMLRIWPHLYNTDGFFVSRMKKGNDPKWN